MLGGVVGGPGAVAALTLLVSGERGHRVWQRRRQYAKDRGQRLAFVNVDGSSSTPSLAAGSCETSFDVERSGALAPDAKMAAYQAPNGGGTDFVGAYFTAVTQYVARSVSSNWASSETAVMHGIKNGFISPGGLHTFTGAYMEGAAQTISMLAASGAAGADAASRATGGPTNLNLEIYQFAAGSASPFQPLGTTGTSNDIVYYTGTAGALQSGERAQSPTWRCWHKTSRRRGIAALGGRARLVIAFNEATREAPPRAGVAPTLGWLGRERGGRPPQRGRTWTA